MKSLPLCPGTANTARLSSINPCRYFPNDSKIPGHRGTSGSSIRNPVDLDSLVADCSSDSDRNYNVHDHGIWALIGPLPRQMMKARHDWLTAPDDPHPQYFFDGARGTLASKGTSGNWTMFASDCASGHALEFHGVSLSDHTNAALAARIVQPESGAGHVTVQIPGSHPEASFTRQQCSVWDVDMHDDGTLANSVRELAGHARFDCSQNGVRIVGDLQLRKCH